MYIVSACLGLLTGFVILKISDDVPKGNCSRLKKSGLMAEVFGSAFFREGV